MKIARNMFEVSFRTLFSGLTSLVATSSATTVGGPGPWSPLWLGLRRTGFGTARRSRKFGHWRDSTSSSSRRRIGWSSFDNVLRAGTDRVPTLLDDLSLMGVLHRSLDRVKKESIGVIRMLFAYPLVVRNVFSQSGDFPTCRNRRSRSAFPPFACSVLKLPPSR